MKEARSCGKGACYGLNCVPQKTYVQVLNSAPQNVTLFGSSLCRYSQVKVRSSGGGSLHYDRCPYEKGKLTHTHQHARREAEGKRHREDACEDDDWTDAAARQGTPQTASEHQN